MGDEMKDLQSQAEEEGSSAQGLQSKIAQKSEKIAELERCIAFLEAPNVAEKHVPVLMEDDSAPSAKEALVEKKDHVALLEDLRKNLVDTRDEKNVLQSQIDSGDKETSAARESRKSHASDADSPGETSPQDLQSNIAQKSEKIAELERCIAFLEAPNVAEKHVPVLMEDDSAPSAKEALVEKKDHVALL